MLLLNNEVYCFLFYDYLHWVGGCVNVGERMTVDAYRGVLRHSDRDSGLWMLVGLIPVIGWIWLLILLIKKGK